MEVSLSYKSDSVRIDDVVRAGVALLTPSRDGRELNSLPNLRFGNEPSGRDESPVHLPSPSKRGEHLPLSQARVLTRTAG